MNKKPLYIILLLCLSGTSWAASNVAKIPSFDQQRRLRDFVEKYKAEHQPKKFTVVAGAVLGSFTDKSSTTPLKGRSKAGVFSLGYQFSPEFSTSAVFVRNRTTEKTADESLRIKSLDDTISASVDYNVLQWLKLDFSFSSKQGRTTTSESGQPNADSVSKNVYRTPSLYLKMTFPINPQFFVAPDIGFSRTYMHDKSYIDNAGVFQPKKDLKLDQAAANTKVGYVVTPNIIPYASLGYSRSLYYPAHLKSRNSFRAGAGAILFGGILNLDWTASKANQSVRSNSFSANLAGKF